LSLLAGAPAPRESLERERAFRVEQLTPLTAGMCGDTMDGQQTVGALAGALRQ
jgi:hypothetical protein